MSIYLIRHGETEWTVSKQHTSFTDLALTPNGVAEAKQLAVALADLSVQRVIFSSRRRARETAEIVFPSVDSEVDDDCTEWNYGEYEGLTTSEIKRSRPNWSIWRDGCPDGESPTDVHDRAQRMLNKLESTTENVAVFSHGHFSRCLATTWIDESIMLGERLLSDTCSVGILSKLGDVSTIETWNWKPTLS